MKTIFLLCLLFLPYELFPQILDVEGGIKISNSATPEPGIIRFNPETNDFEGWNGFFWATLTGLQFETSSLNYWGRTYKTIKIGNQEWFAENLATRRDRYADGFFIFQITDTTEWVNATSPAFCYFINDPNYDNTDGKLYNGYAVDQLDICPTGWHVPSEEEWNTLKNYLLDNGFGYPGPGVNIGKALASVHRWNLSATPGNVGNDPESNNRSGFTGYPSGFRPPDGRFLGYGSSGFWWSSTDIPDGRFYYVVISSNSSTYGVSLAEKNTGFAVRCIKD